ncbi:MAG TPA: hypothetical protein VJC39_05415 [Candidatus Nanoarchaeia archaeon]|nr:hypothetical protein [Candidatus Nanoarchaeia archaeon]
MKKEKNKNSNKNGFTKLMIIFLVFVLIFVIGILIYFFYFGPPVEEAECGLGLGLKVLAVGGKEDICYDQARKEIHLTVENGPISSLEGVYVKIEGQSKDDFLLEEPISKAGVFIGKVPYNLEKQGSITQIEIFPVALVEDTATACLDEVLEFNSLEICNFG